MTASWVTGGLSPAGVESYALLLVALRKLEDIGATTPCQKPADAHLWTSEKYAEREAAGYRCQACPVLALCAAHADDGERWHSWAGADRSPRPKKKEAQP